MGLKTFGKGSVQTVIPISETSAVKLTTARYYTPNGHAIQTRGVIPDVIVEDVIINKKEEDVANFTMSEADYQHALSSKTDTMEKVEKELLAYKHSYQENQKRAKKDPQLSRAVDVLKAIVVTYPG